ncbi:MAG: esterase/lipase family protein [Streptosporangiaceae bacterium]
MIESKAPHLEAWLKSRLLCAAGLALAGVFGGSPASAHTMARSGTATSAGPRATAALPVNYSFAARYAENFTRPAVSPPGADSWSWRRTAAHPYPVVLVHRTFENMNDNWQAAAPILVNHGYCVFSFNYGGSSPNADFRGTGEIVASAGQLASCVTWVLAATGASKVDIVRHSQGGMMPGQAGRGRGGATSG